ncbi:MAG: hypothetical protein K9J37_03660 [Saprospiraceae bacterium]|nr:hypothetical protein [Saprospiraceae bacterium]MCF8248980.1 hypothetical protein [Saprospiraceae bacterium]MCF8279191.1 hypothetical protein [Bacteroidales bacterium]MCF8310874.1 hypothetical protein [Saprospiraceae bacterium]MCF8439538.1 hypothetical protein [Saprospiraceae bacterium]
MKKVTFSALLAVLFLALPNITTAQNAPDDQYFLDWNAKWRQAWMDGDVEAFRAMLPDDLQAEENSNNQGAFSFWALTKESYLQMVERYSSIEKARILKWEDATPGSVSVLRSSDGQTVWLIDHSKLVEEGGGAGKRQIDSVNLTTYFTFQPREGQWMPVTIFENLFHINHFNSWGGVVQRCNASGWFGKKFRFEVAARQASDEQGGRAYIWARVDKADGTAGFFKDTYDAPITSTDWATYTIEGMVDESATKLSIGIIQTTPGTGYFDDFKLSIETSPGKWESVPLLNAGFENADWQNGKPEGWLGNVFDFENFEVEQSAEWPFAGKYALMVTGRK